jgi:hypothetical protein
VTGGVGQNEYLLARRAEGIARLSPAEHGGHVAGGVGQNGWK